MGDYEADAPRASGSDHPARGPSIGRLVALLDQAPEGSRELDAEIWAAFGETHPDFHWRVKAVRYTTSLDAAATLVPEECAWNVGCEIDFTPSACVFGHDVHADECAATPAIALCIAALRAKSQLSALRALAPPDARASGASAQESKDSPP